MCSEVGDEEDELDGQAELGFDRRVLLGVVDRAHSKDDDVDVDVVDERGETEVSKSLCRAADWREQHRQRWRAMSSTMMGVGEKRRKCPIYIPLLTKPFWGVSNIRLERFLLPRDASRRIREFKDPRTDQQ